MKNHRRILKLFLGTSLAVAVLALVGLPSTAFAQKGAGAAKLMRLKPIQTEKDLKGLEPGDMVVMSCPKCKDSWVTVIERPTKGTQAETKQLQRHECPGCETKIVTEGVGKQAKNVVKHVCKNCGSDDAFCCVLKKGSGPTPGMEKK